MSYVIDKNVLIFMGRMYICKIEIFSRILSTLPFSFQTLVAGDKATVTLPLQYQCWICSINYASRFETGSVDTWDSSSSDSVNRLIYTESLPVSTRHIGLSFLWFKKFFT